MYTSLKYKSDDGETYQYHYSFFTKTSIWFSKRLNIQSNCLSAFLFLGLPFFLLFSWMIYEKRLLIHTQPVIFISMVIAGTWLFLGPVLIVNWELSFRRFHEKLQDKLRVNSEIKPKYINKIYFNDAIIRALFSAVFSIVVCLVVFFGIDVYREIGLNYGYSDPVFWLSAFLALQIGFTAGFGFWGVFKTIHSVLIIHSYHDLDWEVFNSDKKGGLYFIYRFILGTAYVFGVGTVVVPFWLQVVAHANNSIKIVSYALVILYSISIISSFIIPSKIVTRIIKEKLIKELDGITKSLNAKIKKEENPDEFLMLMDTFRYLNDYDIVPIKFLKAVEFTAIAIIPFILCVIEILKFKND